jgi:carnitine O-acetyltransferase
MVVRVSILSTQVKHLNQCKGNLLTLFPGVDGHTVLRYVSDIYTDTILRFAKTINSQTQSIFHNYRQRRDSTATNAPRDRAGSTSSATGYFDHNPRKIEWNMTEEVELGVRFAETRLSDLILQNEVKVLEFHDYGKNFITEMKMSPDAFVQVIQTYHLLNA